MPIMATTLYQIYSEEIASVENALKNSVTLQQEFRKPKFCLMNRTRSFGGSEKPDMYLEFICLQNEGIVQLFAQFSKSGDEPYILISIK